LHFKNLQGVFIQELNPRVYYFPGISSLFGNINCDRSAIDDMLGANEGITDNNMLQYLGLIEERTNELLLAQAYVLKQNVSS